MPKLDKKTREQLKIMHNIHKNVLKKKWKCMCPSCSGDSINSHLLQQHGMLDIIAPDNHFYELHSTDEQTWSTEVGPLIFKKVGIKQAISFPLFCGQHDSSLFKSVEMGGADLEDYSSCLLLTYRSICAELRKKQIIVEYFTRIINANSIDEAQKSLYKEGLIGYTMGVTDLERCKEILWREIEKPDHQNFFFKTFKYPLIEVYASATFSFWLTQQLPVDNMDYDNAIFVHIIPQKDATYMVLGYNKSCSNADAMKEYIEAWNGLSRDTLEKKLSTLFVTKIETWGMSTRLYESIQKDNITTYFNKFEEYLYDMTMHDDIGFNMFEGCQINGLSE